MNAQVTREILSELDKVFDAIDRLHDLIEPELHEKLADAIYQIEKNAGIARSETIIEYRDNL